MKERLAELKAEFEKGQQHLQALDQQRTEIRDTLLRISGAIQVLEELLKQETQSSPGSPTNQSNHYQHNGHSEDEHLGVEARL
ncbi:MAG: hypothetical protein NVSMB49_25330 [Ktedonobacteraceae bacterium]